MADRREANHKYYETHKHRWHYTPSAELAPVALAYRRGYWRQYRLAHREQERERDRRRYQKRKLRKLESLV